mmetsp:Transcript_36928/g.99436  ORF Transcript_36928/g.99436 Transcript_36928/m.99436 type:complete len:82 (-) Transcript_36928:1230-1475(-)
MNGLGCGVSTVRGHVHKLVVTAAAVAAAAAAAAAAGFEITGQLYRLEAYLLIGGRPDPPLCFDQAYSRCTRSPRAERRAAL